MTDKKRTYEELQAYADKAIESAIDSASKLVSFQNNLKLHQEAVEELKEEKEKLQQELEEVELRELELKTEIKMLAEGNAAWHRINESTVAENNKMLAAISLANIKLKELLSLSIGQRVFNWKNHIRDIIKTNNGNN
jgi:hypothetical protein